MPTANAEVWDTPRGSYSCMQSTEETLLNASCGVAGMEILCVSQMFPDLPLCWFLSWCWVGSGLVLRCTGAGPSTGGATAISEEQPVFSALVLRAKGVKLQGRKNTNPKA